MKHFIYNVGASCAGVLSFLVGGFDTIFYVLTIFMVMDIVSGLIKAACNKDLNSKTLSNGILKKFSIIFVIIVANLSSFAVPSIGALRDITITLYIANEALSILENVGTYVELPDVLVSLLTQLKEQSNTQEESENE